MRYSIFEETKDTFLIGEFEIKKYPPKEINGMIIKPPNTSASGIELIINNDRIYVVRHPLSPGWIWLWGDIINREIIRKWDIMIL